MPPRRNEPGPQRGINRASPPRDSEQLRQLFRRVWRLDVAPLLRDRPKSRAMAARVTGSAAAAAGLLADGLLGLKGKPITRFMTVMGASIGAMLPDVWDWEWFRKAGPRHRKVVEENVSRRAARLALRDALAIFNLPENATVDDLKRSWRDISKRNHPDKARSDAQKAEFHLRFVAYNAAYKRALEFFEHG